MHSEKIDLIVKALNAAQEKMEGVLKTAENPFYQSHYAPLENYIEAFRKVYLPEGLAFTQSGAVIEGKPYLCTTIWHVSGQWIRSMYPVVPLKADPQSMGAAWTYARRYDLASITGMPANDDDGEEAMGRQHKGASDAAEIPETGVPAPHRHSETPECPRHKRGLRKGDYGYYCTAKEGDPKFANKNGFCNYKYDPKKDAEMEIPF